MTTESVSAEEMQAALSNLCEIQEFLTGKFDSIEGRINVTGEELEKVKAGFTATEDRIRNLERDRVQRVRENQPGITVQSGPYAGLGVTDIYLMRSLAYSQSGRDGSDAAQWIERCDNAINDLTQQYSAGGLEMMHQSADARLAAGLKGLELRNARTHLQQYHGYAPMDSLTTGSGAELVTTLVSQDLWADVHLETLIAGLIPTIPMPSPIYDIPHELGDVDYYPGAENIAPDSTRLRTSRVSLTAYELAGLTGFSFTLEEDSIVPVIPLIRQGLVRKTAETLDDIILNADSTMGNNINADGVTISKSTPGKAHWLVGYDGIMHLPLVDNTAMSNDHAEDPSDDMFNEVRSKMGKYGVRPSELVWVMDVNTYVRSQAVSQFRTMDKLGPNATIVTGMLGAIEGIPVVASEQMPLADADGKVTDAGNATNRGRLLIFNRTQWLQGFRRDLTIESQRDTAKRQTVITTSFRHALTERSADRSTSQSAALQYNITV